MAKGKGKGKMGKQKMKPKVKMPMPEPMMESPPTGFPQGMKDGGKAKKK